MVVQLHLGAGNRSNRAIRQTDNFEGLVLEYPVELPISIEDMIAESKISKLREVHALEINLGQNTLSSIKEKIYLSKALHVV